MNRIQIAVVLVLLAASIFLFVKAASAVRKRVLERDRPDVLHVQANAGGSGSAKWSFPANACPPGYERVKDLFNEADGSKQDAWIREGSKGNTLDYLLPGESVNVGVMVYGPGTRPKI